MMIVQCGVIDMGMYNEVFKRCPRCGKSCETQISQVVLGFGNFDLDTLYNVQDLTTLEQLDLCEKLDDEIFYCGCGTKFKVDLRKLLPTNSAVTILD
jgi:hypothetical protein